MANPFFRKIVLLLAILFLMMCPVLFISVQFFPGVVSFLEPVLCPEGTHLASEIEEQEDLRGNITASYSVCVGENQETVDVTGKMLLILACLPTLGVILLVIWAVISPGKKTDTPTITLNQQ
jgi:hypothetical protein